MTSLNKWRGVTDGGGGVTQRGRRLKGERELADRRGGVEMGNGEEAVWKRQWVFCFCH